MISSRHPSRLHDFSQRAGVGVGTLDEAIDFSELLVDTLPFKASFELDAEALAGKTLISVSNYYPSRDGQLDIGDGVDTAALALRLPRTQVTKAFNVIPAADFAQAVQDPEGHKRIVVPIVGDNPESLDVTARLVEDAGYDPVRTGDLVRGLLFTVGTEPYGANWTAAEYRAWLAKQ